MYWFRFVIQCQQTQEIMFSTQRDKPDAPTTILNGQSITMCDKVYYLGVLVDHKLRFEEHVESIVAKAEQRTHIVRNSVHQ